MATTGEAPTRGSIEMSCSCIYAWAGEPGSLNSARFYKARKEHKCTECHRVISPGEEYEYTFGVWDGEPGIYKTCSDCLSVRDTFFCKGWVYSQVWEDVHQHLLDTEGQIESECLLSLTSTAREWVIDWIDKLWEEDSK
jgi:hypothetical protein